MPLRIVRTRPIAGMWAIKISKNNILSVIGAISNKASGRYKLNMIMIPKPISSTLISAIYPEVANNPAKMPDRLP